MAGVSHRNMIFGVLVSVTILKLFIPTSTYIFFLKVFAQSIGTNQCYLITTTDIAALLQCRLKCFWIKSSPRG